MGRVSFFFFLSLPSSPSVCLFSCSFSLSRSVLCPKCERRQFHFTLHPIVLSCIAIHLSLTFLSPLCSTLPVSLPVKRQSCSRVVESWLPCFSCVAKHIKAVCRHICQSQMMIRVPGLSKGTQSFFVMQGIPPYLSAYILHQTLVRQRSYSLWF